uniref:Uncharacterized protein n=1 Tax=Arundo donax TaxID=35708 RepID=A0A0A9B6G6_ARUDO
MTSELCVKYYAHKRTKLSSRHIQVVGFLYF